MQIFTYRTVYGHDLLVHAKFRRCLVTMHLQFSAKMLNRQLEVYMLCKTLQFFTTVCKAQMRHI